MKRVHKGKAQETLVVSLLKVTEEYFLKSTKSVDRNTVFACYHLVVMITTVSHSWVGPPGNTNPIVKECLQPSQLLGLQPI